ncbi:spermatogenesis-associated protein 31D1-like isoform X2 [Mesocricetus auratus]|uniref:Spermatogenesis-associated protein 31D1-like isoform X2 n=1 Tax=Mesocricetus auratus TaxID=10036 RepID=A0ABM2YB65_MESAU|nr:spermatogenesis-associated protein 31D1-like isoform X2 [Mesocricetus auratus]
MENILSSLNSLAETWLVFGSVSCHVDLHYTLLSGLGLLLVYVCYLVLKLAVPSLWKKKCTQKLQEKAEGARESQKGGSTGRRDTEEGKTLQRPPGKPYDPSDFHLLPCPDSLCGVGNKASDQASCLLSRAPLEDGTASTFQVASAASTKEPSSTLFPRFPSSLPGPPASESLLQPSPSPLSTLPPNLTTQDGIPSPTPLNAPPLGPPVLLGHTPRKPLAPFPALHATQETQLVLQQEAPLSFVESPTELPPNVSTAKGAVCKGQAVSAPSPAWPSAKDQPLTKLPHINNQPPLDPHGSQASYRRLTKTHTEEPGNSLSPTPEVLPLSKRQEEVGTDLTASEHKEEETESCSMPPNSSGKISAPVAGPQNMEVSLLLGDGKGDPHLLQQPSHPKASEDQSEIKDAQFFWGLPSLHSESLKHEAEASGNSYSVCTDFNKMTRISAGNESAACTHPVLLPLPERDQHVWLQTLPESQTKSGSHSESEAPQPQIQDLPPSPLSQLRVCGVRFHSPPDEAQPLGPSELKRLEYNLLQKTLESLLGLPTVTQRSQESICPPPPKVSLMRKSFKLWDPKNILPGDFPIAVEVRRKLEHHLRKRLIQHLWGLPHRVRDSLSLMSPQPELPEFPEPWSSQGPSLITLYKHNTRRQLSGFGISQSESFHKEILATLPLKEKDMQVQRDGPGTDQKDHLQRDSHGAAKSREFSDTETDPELQPGNLSGRFAKPSWIQQHQKMRETFLQERMSGKTKETSRGKIPGPEDRGQHSINEVDPPFETPPRQLKDQAGEEDPLKKHQQSLALDASKEELSGEHIKTFDNTMTFDHPQRVEESLESYKTRVEPPRSLSQFHAPSHADPAVDSVQSSRFPERSSTGRDGMQTLNFTPIQEVPLPASCPVSQVRPASENKEVFTDKGTAQSGRQSPELPMRPEDPTEERLASSTNAQGPQGERLSWRAGPMAEGSTEPLKGEPTKVLTSTQGPCSPGRDSTTCQPLQGMSAPYNPGTSDYKAQVSRGVVLHSESRPPSASGEMTSKCQGPSSGDMVASQVLRVHLPTAGVSMESAGRGPWFPAHESDKCQNQECPPAAKRESPLAAEAGKLGGGDAGLGTSQTRGKRRSVQARAPEETHGHTASLALSPKGQPPENHFTSQVKCFLQWMSPGQKHKGQERSLAKGSSPSPPVKVSSLIKGRCDLYRNTEAQKCVRDPGVILRKPLGHRHGTVIPCPQAPAPPPVGSGETQQKEQRRGSCCQAACSQVQKAESCSPGEGQTAPKRCGVAGKAEMVISPMRASQGTRVPPKSCL